MTAVQKFDSLYEFEGVVAGLDDYATLPIYAAEGTSLISTQRFKAMTNVSKRRITMTVGKDYPVFGHREALGYVARDLASRKCDVHGHVEIAGDRTYTRLLFKGLAVNDAKDSKVELGMSFNNPMDRKTTFKGFGFTWRQTCSNGAGMKTMLPNMVITERHTEDMETRVPPIIHDFISQSLANSNFLQVAINKAIETKVVFEDRQQMLNTMLGQYTTVTERHVKAITKNIETLEPTRWDLFNASSFYTSHHAVSPEVREDIDAVAESFLNINRPINVARRIPAIAPIIVA